MFFLNISIYHYKFPSQTHIASFHKFCYVSLCFVVCLMILADFPFDFFFNTLAFQENV